MAVPAPPAHPTSAAKHNERTATRRPVERGWWLGLVLVCALAAALRFYRIDAQSLWYDEGISAHQLTRTFAGIARAASLDTHPPLYYWLLKLWGTAFGASELGLRSLSAVLGVAVVALTGLLGRDLFDEWVGFVAALLVAVSPLAVYYSQEVRMYTLVAAMALLAAWAYVRRRAWLYVPAAAATLYSQYLGVAILAAVNLHAVLWWRSMGGQRGWTRWLLANAAVALAFLPWLPVFLVQSTQRALNTSPRTVQGVLLDSVSAYGGGLAQGPAAEWGGVALLALAGAGLLLLAARARRWQTRAAARHGSLAAQPSTRAGAGREWSAGLAFLLWVVPLGLVLALGLRSGLFELRYLLLSVPGLALLAGAGIVGLTRLAGARWRLVPPALAALLLAAPIAPAIRALDRQYFDPSLARDDYRGLAREIERLGQPGDAIILAAPNQVEVFSFYYRGPLPVFPLPAQRPPDERDLLARLEAIRASYQRVWLVSWAIREADPRDTIETWLGEQGFPASHQWFGTVQLSLVAFSRAGTLQRVDAPLDNGIELVGYRLNARILRPGDTLALTLVWRAREAPRERWKVFTHLLDARPKVVAQRDAEPGGSLRPTTSWRAGEQVEDNYGILVPADLAPGTYTLEVGMYRESGRRATFVGKGDHLLLGSVEVAPPR